VFRFPRRRNVWPELEREIGFLGETCERFSVRVPQYFHVAPESTAAPNGYAVYSYVPGSTIAANTMSATEQRAAAEAIAAFLRMLHTIEAPALQVRLPRQDERDSAIELLRQAESIVMSQLSHAQAAVLREQFAQYIDTAAHFCFVPVVRHADLGADHILAVNQSVAGVIDFSDVSVGDPDYDFSSLFIDLGEAFTMDIARCYGHPHLDQLRAKLEYFAIADFVDTLVSGEGIALRGQVELAWRRLREYLDGTNAV
jgi:aminoglycoside 2''-phosphotransferase